MPEVKVMRKDIAQYYGITTDGTTTYTHMGTGFLKLSEENSPQVDSVAFINNSNDSPSIIGYQNKWSFESQYIAGNAAVDDIAAIARDQKTGTDCERLLVDVELNNPVSGTTYRARKFAVAVEATGPNGDPKNVTKLTGNFHQIGDLVKGTFNITTKAFTADTAATTYAVTMTVVPASANVILRDSDDAQIPVTVNDVSGVVTIPALANGTYEYSVFADGYVTEVATFTVASGAVSVGTITITEPA